MTIKARDDLRVVAPPPGSRFTVMPETVLDNRTGIMWQRAVSPEVYTWAEAKKYTKSLTLAGYSDWRLPTKEELMSIVVKGPAPAIDTETFPNTPSEFFWSSSPYASYATGYAWGVDFDFGDTDGSDTTYGFRVRCAR